MNIAGDMETRIVGFGLTQSDAMKDLQFNLERSGKLSASRLERRKEIHAWLPKPHLLHVKGIGAMLYDNNFFISISISRTSVTFSLRQTEAHNNSTRSGEK